MTFPTTMRALQLQAIDRLAELRVPVPRPKPDEVLVRTVATTICTSDLNDIARNPFGIVLPRVMGHEGAGVVAALGEGVSQFQVGDRVAAHPVIPCRDCENCQRGRIQPGETILIVGDGPFGVLIARLASRCEPSRVIVVGRHEFRLRQVPSAVAINEKRTPEVRRVVREANDGRGVDVAVMATGSASAMELGLISLRARGRLVVFSAVHGTPSVDWFRLHTQELEILGACNDQHLVDAALDRLADAELGLSSLVTHRLPFAQWPRAFELARHGKDEALKVALVFEELPERRVG